MDMKTQWVWLESNDVSWKTSFLHNQNDEVHAILGITPEILTMYTIPWVDQNISVRSLERYAACDKKIDYEKLKNLPFVLGLLQSHLQKEQLTWIEMLATMWDEQRFLWTENIVLQSIFPEVWYQRHVYLFIRFGIDKRAEFANVIVDKLMNENDEEMLIQATSYVYRISNHTILDRFIHKIILSWDLHAILTVMKLCKSRWYTIKTEYINEIAPLVGAIIEHKQSIENQLLWLQFIEYWTRLDAHIVKDFLMIAADSPYEEVRFKAYSIFDMFQYDSTKFEDGLGIDLGLSTIIFEKVRQYLTSDYRINFELIKNDKNAQLLLAHSVNSLGAGTIFDLLEIFWIKSDESKPLEWVYPEAIFQLSISAMKIKPAKAWFHSIEDKEIWLLYIQPNCLKKDFQKKWWADFTIKWNSLVRHFPPEQFLAWKILYENYALRKEYWFDYVPIEPIQAFYQRLSWLVDVYVGILDCNLKTRLDELSNWSRNSKLRDDLKKIEDVFNAIGFSHGHTWGNPSAHNCVLRFWRKEDGSVDFTKKPRIYVIDFDQAKFIHNYSQNNT